MIKKVLNFFNRKSNNLSSRQVLSSFGWLKINVIQIKSKLLVTGFYTPPLSSNCEAEICCDGLLIKKTVQHHDVIDLGNSSFKVFTFSIEGKLSKSKIIHFYLKKDGRRINTPFHDWFWIQKRRNISLRKMQYIGADDSDWFNFSGGTWAEKSLRTYEYFTKKNRSTISTILDWGCGVGRISQHYPYLCKSKIVGLDIDYESIKHCKKIMPQHKFYKINASPPCALPDKCADMIIGHSVLTHLDEDQHLLWLAELNRLIKPDGLILLSILSIYGEFLEPLSDSEKKKLSKNGFLIPTETKKENNIHFSFKKSGASYPLYHKGVFISHEYILKNWGNKFEILSIIEGYADHHAVVVLKQKKSN